MGTTSTTETPGRPTVYAVDEYEPQSFDTVLVQQETVVGLQQNPPLASVIPLAKVNRVDGDPSMVLTGPEIPESFYGGARYGFVDLEAFPHVAEHLDAMEREQY